MSDYDVTIHDQGDLARVAELEAQLEKAIVAELDAESLQEQAEAALAERDRMLRLVAWDKYRRRSHQDDYLADLRARAEEGSG